MSYVEEGLFSFAVELYKTIELFKESQTENTIVSPFLLSTALVALLNGSRDNTAAEISEVLFGKTLAPSEYKSLNQQISQLVEKTLKSNGKLLSAANLVYADTKYPIASDFQQLADKSLAVKVKPLDSSKLAKDIADSTNGKVSNFNSKFSADRGVVLASAAHAKGRWKLQFNPKDIKVEKFRTPSGEQVDVEMMFESNKYRTSYNDELKCNAVEIPYENSNLVLLILKPYTNSSLEELGFNLDANLLAEVVNTMSQPIRIDLYVPKFKLETSVHLQTFLDRLNIKDLFSSDDAKLSGVSKDAKGLAVGDIIQKVAIEINEEGTSQEVPTAYQFKPKEFKVNRPFMFLLISRLSTDSSLILFTGAVNNPKK